MPEIGAGPNNIVVSKLYDVKEIKILKNKIYFDDIEKTADKIFKSKIEGKIKIEKKTIDYCINILLRYAPSFSTAFIFDNNREKDFKTQFQKKLLENIKKGVGLIQKKRYGPGTKKLSGLGLGLTPSGDDFLSGFVLAMRLKGDKTNSNIILNSFKTKNLISLNSIKNSFDKRADEKTKEFLFSIKSNNKKDIYKSMIKIIKKGHTSGSDFLSGFLFYFKLNPDLN
ncbi:MAG: DUF2877 domain-containing protein [Elusimicrobiales bacterium]|nr:DUF2877 domain-containing protein [Elusimicrobiales bacterium]